MKFIKLLSLFLTMCLCVPGVYALWQYSPLAIGAAISEIESEVDVFDYPPEVIVPGNQSATNLGENHLDIIRIIIEEKDYGLNATKKPIIHNYLEEVGDVVYCSQHTTGGNLKHLMIDSTSSAERLYFIITKISDTEYHTFTMRYADLTSSPVGTEIEVYKTIMVKENGAWKATYSYYGKAKVNAPVAVSRGIDVTSWRYVHKS